MKGNDKKILKDEQQLAIYSHITKSLKNKDIDIFDREILIKNLISSLIWGSLHTLDVDNAWFFWNQYTLKLTPILSDQGPWMLTGTKERLLEQVKYLPFYYNFVFNEKPLTKKEFIDYFDELSLLFNQENFINDINSFKKKYFKGDSLFSYSPLSQNIKLINNNFEILIKQINNIELKKTHNKELTKTKIESIKKFIDIKHFYDGKIYLFNLLDVPIYVEQIYSNNKTFSVNKFLSPSDINNLSSLTLKTNFIGQNDYKINVVSSYKNLKIYRKIKLV